MLKPAKWKDLFALLFSLVAVGGAALWTVQSGILSASLGADAKLSWHLVRSAGITSYILLTASMAWGLLLSSRVWKDWSPGSLSMTLHATVSWLALILGLVHGLLLMFDKYYTYTLREIFVPFTGPYRPEYVGLGTLAFWIALVVTLSFAVRKLIGRRVWRWIHMASYLSFGMVTVHGLMAGTDGHMLGFRILMFGSLFAVILLLGIRLTQPHGTEKPEKSARREVANRMIYPG